MDQIPAGLVEDRPVSSLDLFATAHVAARATVTTELDGVSLLPFIAAPDKAAAPRRLYWRVGPQAALRQGDWKIHRGRGDSSWQLFNVAQDPAESQNLAASQADRLAKLVTAWEQLDAEMVAPRWLSQNRNVR
jgi:arylsulfatase A-like enzyme